MSIENNNTGNTYSLKMLLEKYFFVIPEYQRDYAQGRDNERDVHVLDMFIKEIYEILSSDESEEHTLHLDYVYGDIAEKNGVGFFYPIDGQQRLTTLFLFYICCYQTVTNETEKSFLSKLKYDIRPTSNKLIVCLIRNGFKEPDSTTPAWKQWVDLYSEISRDPTAEALLRAYRKIEKVLCEGKHKEYKKKLESITFEVVDTKEHNLPKTVFWKMNARGRSLTQSEVFKAAFFSSVELARTFDYFVENLICLIPDADKDYQVLEKTLMNIVNIIFEGFKEIRYPANSHAGFDFWKAPFISKDKYLEYQTERKDEICQIFSALKTGDPFNAFDNALPEYVKKKIDGEILNCLVKKSGLTQNIRALFFSYLIALPIESESLKEWMRVCSNLIWNSSDVGYALKIISKLKGNAASILEFLSEDKGIEFELNQERNSEINTALRQYQEERAKASAVKNKDAKKEDIEIAESTAFADGRIDFLYFSGWEGFSKRLKNFDILFDENGVRKDKRFDVVTAYIKLSPWDWDECYFDTTRDRWKSGVFNGIHDKDFDDGYKHIVEALLSTENISKITLEDFDTNGRTDSSRFIRQSLIDNSWFVKWMMDNCSDYYIKWKGSTPIFSKRHSQYYYYFDVRNRTNDAGIQNRQTIEFFVRMSHVVTPASNQYCVVDKSGNTVVEDVTDFSKIDFSTRHLIMWGYYTNACYIKFYYKTLDKPLYLTVFGLIVTDREYRDGIIPVNNMERSIYDVESGVLKQNKDLEDVLDRISLVQ